MLKIYGEPNQSVTMLVKTFGNRRLPKWLFTFDEKGTYIIDDTKLSRDGIKRIKQAFKCVEIADNKKEVKSDDKIEENTQDFTKINFLALKKIAKDKGMEVTPTTNKEDILNFLSEV